MKVIFTTPVLGYPPIGGPELRIVNSIKALNDICELHIISRIKLDKNAENFYKNKSKNFITSPSVLNLNKNIYFYRLKKILNYLFFKKTTFDDYLLELDANFIINYAIKNNVKLIWFGYGNISYKLIKIIKERAPFLKIICDTDSVWSRFILRELPYIPDLERIKKIKLEGKEKEKEENYLANISDVITAVSSIDSDYYKYITKDKDKVKNFSNVIDVNDYLTCCNLSNKFKKPSIFLSGSFGKNSPMEYAARWFIEKVFPLIKLKIDDINFYIVGNCSDKVLSDINDSSIIIMGKVESILPYLKNADVVVVPLFFESGTRFKILEAGICGVPIVSTTLGAEGLNIVNGENILIEDKEDLFAEAVVNLIKDKSFANKISNNCKTLILENYSLDKLKKEGLAILSKFN